MTYYVSNDLLENIESQIRTIHGKLITGIAHNVMNDSSKILEMKKKYLRYHSNTSVRTTLRPPRSQEKMTQEEEERQELYNVLKEDFESDDEDYDNKERCLLMVRVGRKIRQCRCVRSDDNILCERHSEEIVFPFGLKNHDSIMHMTDIDDIDALLDEVEKEEENNKKVNDFLSDDE